MSKLYKLLIFIIALGLVCFHTITVNGSTKISKTKSEIYVGNTINLKIKGVKTKVKWSSSKKSVAIVNSKGNVTAKKVGTTFITANDGNKKYICIVKVINDDTKDKTYKVKINKNTVKVTGHFEKTIARKMFNDINKYRVKNGLNKLAWNEKLYNSAKIRGYEISLSERTGDKYDTFSHTRPNGKSCKTLSLVKGENIARWGNSSNEIIKAWKNSKGHKENILYEDYTYGAIAVFYRNVNGRYRYYWINEFGM